MANPLLTCACRRTPETGVLLPSDKLKCHLAPGGYSEERYHPVVLVRCVGGYLVIGDIRTVLHQLGDAEGTSLQGARAATDWPWCPLRVVQSCDIRPHWGCFQCSAAAAPSTRPPTSTSA